jgi:hypothetical protein
MSRIEAGAQHGQAPHGKAEQASAKKASTGEGVKKAAKKESGTAKKRGR